MSISKRYASIVAILDDPVNKAIVLRELSRRPDLRIIVPYRLRQAERSLFDLDDLIYRVAGEDPRPVAEVVRDGIRGFWVVAGDDEVGPFPTREVAIDQAAQLLSARSDYTVLDVSPWGEDEEKAYPMPE